MAMSFSGTLVTQTSSRQAPIHASRLFTQAGMRRKECVLNREDCSTTANPPGTPDRFPGMPGQVSIGSEFAVALTNTLLSLPSG